MKKTTQALLKELEKGPVLIWSGESARLKAARELVEVSGIFVLEKAPAGFFLKCTGHGTTVYV